MPGKVNRNAYQALIVQDLAWLESLPPTLERGHVIAIVGDSINAYHEPAGSCLELPVPGKDHDRRPGMDTKSRD